MKTRPRPARVLVIEDHPGAQLIVRRILGEHGLCAEFAGDGRAGLERAFARVPDLLILDLKLPGYNGFEVLRLLRADRRTRGVPVVVLTGLLDEDQILRAGAFGLGAEDFIEKGPATRERLRAALRKHLGEGPVARVLERGRIRLDTGARLVFVAGKAIAGIGRRRLGLLRALLESPGPLSVERLGALVWGECADLRSVARAVQRLREDLGPGAAGAIVSARGQYQLIG